MGKRSIILAIFVGTLTAAAVWLWPAGPLWQTGPGAGRIGGFSADGRVLVTADMLSNKTHHLARWDARTGRLLSRAVMEWDKSNAKYKGCRVFPSSDGALALVGQSVRVKAPPEEAYQFGYWFLHDGITGRRIFGPIEGANHVANDPFSDAFSMDGRWFAAYQGDPQSGVTTWDRLAIYSTATGKRVVELPRDKDRSVVNCRFAKDGDSAAQWWRPDGNEADTKSFIVQIVELPSARQLKRIEFPPNSWRQILRWDGRFLTTVAATKQLDKRTPMARQIVFDFEQNPIVDRLADPMLADLVDESGETMYCAHQSTSEWAAYFSLVGRGVSRPGLAGWVDGLGLRLGWARDMTKEVRASVRMIDRATGETRYPLPRPVSASFRFSADGKLLACGGDDSLEVWDTDPPPRWPKAIAWGFIAAGTVILVGRWRRVWRQSPAPAVPMESGHAFSP